MKKEAIVLGALLIIVGSCKIMRLINQWYTDHPCIKQHEEVIYVPMSINYIDAGNGVLVPVITPEQRYTQTVCDKRK